MSNTKVKVEKNEVSLSASQSKSFEKLPSKSAKIRFLTSLEWTRRQIADKIGISYQHVRNVQITPLTSAK